jgi:hypothetical protein
MFHVEHCTYMDICTFGAKTGEDTAEMAKIARAGQPDGLASY